MIQIIKKRRFATAASASTEDVETAVKKLQHYPGIIATRLIARDIEVEYDLASCDFFTLRNTLTGLLPLVQEGGFKKLKTEWIMFTESNERDHHLLPAGWSHHTQKLYLSLHPADRRIEL